MGYKHHLGNERMSIIIWGFSILCGILIVMDLIMIFLMILCRYGVDQLRLIIRRMQGII
jgi:hypothetical protein